MTTKKNNKTKEAKKNCFVISPIGEEDSEVRKRSDQVLKHVITPAVTECGYTPIRSDKISEPGIITTQVIQHIADDPMVIADLTGRNANVFYELAVRHAIKKPVVQIIGRDERIPFDVAATRIIVLDHTDLDSVEDAKKEIISQIRAAEAPKFEPETPISVAVQLQSLRRSEQPEDKRSVDILLSLQEIQKSVIRCERKLSNPEEIFPPAYLSHVIRRSSGARIDPKAINDLLVSLEQFEFVAEKLVKKPSDKLRKEVDEMYSRLRMISRYIMRELER